MKSQFKFHKMLVCMALILVACVGLTVGITLTFYGDSKSGSTEIKLGASIEFDGENGVSVATSDGLTVVPSQTVDVETTLVVKNGADGDPTSGVLKVIPSLTAGSTGAKLTLTAGSTYDVYINGTKSIDTVMVVYNGDLYLAEKSNAANLKVFTPTTSGITIKFTVPITFPNSLGNSASGQKCTITMTGIVLQSLIHSESGEVPTTIVDFIPYFEDFSGISGPSVSVLTLGEPTIETTTIESTGTEVVESMQSYGGEVDYIISTLNISNVPTGSDITFDYFPYVMVDSSLMSMYSEDDKTVLPIIEAFEACFVVKGSYASYDDMLADEENIVQIEDCYTTSEDGVVSFTIPNSYLENGEMSLTLLLGGESGIAAELDSLGISGITVKYSNNNSTMTTTKTTQNWVEDNHAMGSDISDTKTILTDTYDTASITYSYTNYRVSNPSSDFKSVSITLNNSKAKSVLVLPNAQKNVGYMTIGMALNSSSQIVGNFDNGSITLNIPASDLTDFCVVEIYDPSDVTTGQSLSTSSLYEVSNITSSDSSSLKFTYAFEDDFTLSAEVAGVLDENISSVVIPENYNGIEITGIGNSAFKNCISLTSITIPASVTSIGSYAFYGCTSLTSVTIPENVTSIGSYAFYGCTSLTSVTIPENVTSIGSYAFDGCSALTSVTFAENSQLTSIGNCTFRDCVALTSITIPASVTSIGSNAFYGCTSLTSITIPENVTSIGIYAFAHCSAVTEINYNATACEDITSTSYLFISTGQNGNGIIVNIGANVTKIPAYLFKGSNIISVTSAENSQLVIINDYSFYGCKALTSITIPSSVTSIGSNAFAYCSALTEINYNATACEDFTSSSNCPFVQTGQNGDGITVNIGANVTKIPANLFYKSEKIIAINFAENGQLTSIGDRAFMYCRSLTSITIPEGVSIGDSAFWGSSALTSITIPEGVTSIGSNAFAYCSALTEINYNATACEDFTSSSNCPFVPTGEDGDGITVNIGANVTKIPAYLFHHGSNIISVTFAENSQLTSIGSEAFYNCTSLKSITIPSGVTSIGSKAFCGCRSLTSITIPESVTSISSMAFYDCCRLAEVINLSSLNIKAGSNYHGYVASYAARVVTSGTSQITTEGDFKFVIGNDDNKYLVDYIGTSENITIPDCYGILGAFSDNDNITSITIPENVISIGNNAFDSCTALTSVTFAKNSQLVSIGNRAFSWCVALTSITIPENVISIGNNAFSNCTSLMSITFTSENPPTISNDDIFINCSTDIITYVPDEYYDTYVNTTVSGWSNYTSKIQKLSTKA